jgi:hypothetical protein
MRILDRVLGAAAIVSLALAGLLIAQPAFADESPKAEAADKSASGPSFEGWTVKKEVAASREKLDQMETKLGAKLKSLRNIIYEVGGQKVELAIFVAADADGAAKIHKLVSEHKAEWASLLKGDTVYEFVGHNDVVEQIKKAREQLAGQ